MTALRLAHRGDWRVAPENSLEAMRAALANPACDGLEFDVRFSRDGVPILLHDESLERVQRIDSRAADLTAAELAGHGVPTLESVLELASERLQHHIGIRGASGAAARVLPFLDIELKEPANGAFFELLDSARGRPDGRLDRAVVSSFDPDVVAAVRDRRPEWPLWGNTRDLEPVTIRIARDLGCAGLSAEWSAIDAEGARRVRDGGLELAAWTVRRRSTFDRLERLGVTALCTEASALDG